jgi:hypothetical protein
MSRKFEARFEEFIEEIGRERIPSANAPRDAASIIALNQILDDSEWGRFAVAAVHAIRAKR